MGDSHDDNDMLVHPPKFGSLEKPVPKTPLSGLAETQDLGSKSASQQTKEADSALNMNAVSVGNVVPKDETNCALEENDTVQEEKTTQTKERNRR